MDSPTFRRAFIEVKRKVREASKARWNGAVKRAEAAQTLKGVHTTEDASPLAKFLWPRTVKELMKLPPSIQASLVTETSTPDAMFMTKDRGALQHSHMVLPIL